MKHVLMMLALSFSLMPFGNIAQASLPNTLQAGDTKLVLNGDGTRTKYGIKLYKAGLYLKAEKNNADGNVIAAADEAMAVRMEVTSGLITEERLSTIVREGFASSTGSKTAMKAEIDQLIGAFAKNIKKGDVCNLIYVPGEGTAVYKNGIKGVVIKGLAFKKALFGIWVGPKPAQQSLKDEMLDK